MPETTPDIEPAKPSNHPIGGWALQSRIVDKRSREWKRRQEIVAMLLQQFPAEHVTDAILRRIHAAAELLTIAEMARAKFMAGDGVTLDDVVRVERAANLAEARLSQHLRKAPATVDLASYLSARKAAA